jgi:F0F1-type ATP synthase alpha subunit
VYNYNLVNLKKNINAYQLQSKTQITSNELGEFGIVINVSDEIIHSLGLPNIKFGEIIYVTLDKKTYDGLVINIS